jgi:hypothetical protein
MAYFRLHQKYPLNQILAQFVDPKYCYETAREMLRVNIVPVCLDTIAPDNTTLPPRLTSKRGSGRPRKKRIRKRPNTAGNPADSIVRCSRCNRQGHNARTCHARGGGEGDEDERKPSPVAHANFLDLS